MICPNCNHKVRENADFCGNCGFKLKKREDIKKISNVCPVCGTHIKTGHGFCTECGYQFHNADTIDIPDSFNEKKARRKNHIGLKIGLGIIGVLLLVILIVILLWFTGILHHSSNKKSESEPISTEEIATTTESSAKTDQTSESAPDTSATSQSATDTSATSESAPGTSASSESNKEVTTESDASIPDQNNYTLGGVGADNKVYPTKITDFVEYNDPGGVYTFFYPKNFFKTGTYNNSDKKYEFRTNDSHHILTISEEEAPVKNDPKKSAEQKCAEAKQLFELSSGEMFTFESKKVSDTGYYRTIITGPDKLQDGLGRYIVFAATNEKVYTLTYIYQKDMADEETEMSFISYLTECLYRGWSISGASYKMRDYDNYLSSEDMGEKK